MRILGARAHCDPRGLEGGRKLACRLSTNASLSPLSSCRASPLRRVPSASVARDTRRGLEGEGKAAQRSIGGRSDIRSSGEAIKFLTCSGGVGAGWQSRTKRYTKWGRASEPRSRTWSASLSSQRLFAWPRPKAGEGGEETLARIASDSAARPRGARIAQGCGLGLSQAKPPERGPAQPSATRRREAEASGTLAFAAHLGDVLPHREDGAGH